MQRLSLLSVGKIKTSWISEGCALYTERLRRSCDLIERVLGSGTREEENDKILQSLEKSNDVIVVLDETGKNFSSAEFASWLGKERDRGSSVTFVLGGAYGLTEAVQKKGTLVLSLGRMTLPHELCKLVFLEQLYRAHAILSGSGYHH